MKVLVFVVLAVVAVSVSATCIFQDDIEIPVGVDVVVETVSGPSGAVASGGVYAVSDNLDPHPFELTVENELWIRTRSGDIGGGRGDGGTPIAFMPKRFRCQLISSPKRLVN